MAETATIPAPPVAPAKAAPAEIKVSEMQPTLRMNEPRPGSARAAIRAELEKKAGVVPAAPAAPAAPKPEVKPAPKTPPPPKPAAASIPEEENLMEQDPEAPKEEMVQQAPEEKTEMIQEGEKPKSGKPSPWKIVETYKERLTKAETELAEIRTKLGNPAEVEKTKSTLTALQQRNKELEDEIRYVNYEKSTEFKEKFEAPYRSAWNRATAELAEIAVKDNQTGETRAATAQDLLVLVNLPLGQARGVANEVFGEFADDMMAHRKEIKTLFDAQRNALEEARTKGAEREKTVSEHNQAAMQEIRKSVKDYWDQETAALLEDPKVGHLFKEKEGDEEWNTSLKKGYALVDKSFNENPNDPRLTPKQRQEIVKRHAAFRNRAAGWGPLKRAYDKQSARLAELEKKLAEVADTTPSTDGGQSTGTVQTTNGGGKARDQVVNALRGLAKP